ncbi:hypothetical protein [Enemella sp. A6]
MYDMYPRVWIERIAEREAIAPKRRARKPRDLTPPSLRRAKAAAVAHDAA